MFKEIFKESNNKRVEKASKEKYGNIDGYGAFFFDLSQQKNKKKFEALIKSSCNINASTDSVCEFSFKAATKDFIKLLKNEQSKLNNNSYLKYK